MFRSFFFITFLMLSGSILPWNAYGGTGTLEITATGFDNAKGTAQIALINSAENWEAKIPFKGFSRPITDGRASIRVEGLPFGEYAIKVFHDENGNKDLDTRIFGIPAERYGFSNDARSPFGPPDFEDARFVLDSPAKSVSVQVQPYLGQGGKTSNKEAGNER